MRGTVNRCHYCQHALEQKRSRDSITICFCNLRGIQTPGQTGETSHVTELATPPAKLIQRE